MNQKRVAPTCDNTISIAPGAARDLLIMIEAPEIQTETLPALCAACRIG
jgi:hypothetical protein